MFSNIIIHYSEIGTKGDNRKIFEMQLMNNINYALKNQVIKTYRIYGRIICDLQKDCNLMEIKQILENIPGISYFSFSEKSSLNFKELQKTTINFLKDRDFRSFKVVAKRSNKQYQFTSLEINRQLGEFIQDSLKKEVNLENPDLFVYVEVCEKAIFLFTEKYTGIGGLPVSKSSRVICSLSGGIDSPVSSYLMMKRGCEVVFVHFFNNTNTSQLLLRKIEKLVDILTKFQLRSKLYIVPFSEVQNEIVKKVNPDYRMIIYRRFMMKIIDKISIIENTSAIITGDSVGQVASQTLENLSSIYSATKQPVLSPLIGMNKIEIIEISKKIKTYETSILKYPDCCSFMISKHPKTKSEIEDIIYIEKNLNEEELVNYCVNKAIIKNFKFNKSI